MSINAKIYLKTLLLLWFTAIIFRFIFLIWQWDLISTHSAKDIATAFYIGLRFDGRISAFASVPLMIFLFIPFLGRLFGKIKIVMLALYTLIFFVIFFLYVGDFANYAYLQQRSTFETLEQLRDLKESVQMVWQTYPVIRLLLAAFTFSFIMNRILKRIFNKWEPSQMRLAKRGGSFAACFLLLGILIYGQYTITYYPLRWSQAYFSGYYELAALALNPIQNLYDTKPADNKVTYDESATRAGYTLVADYLKVSHPDAEANPMRYDRFVTGDGTKDYNVVMIVLESLSTHKSVFMFEELESTPFLKELSEKGLYFPNYYASARTTARSMFSIVTGIPDVTESYSSSSRDPGLVDQQVIWNQFQGYTKLFSLGGSANWANLRGILTNNVPGLSIYEETYWKAPKVDVWGITDLNLLQETHELLLEQKEPFFSLILTSGVHRPFTVPAGVEGFDYDVVPDKEFLDKYGFVPEEYLSMRFVDFALKRFFEEAEKSPYFENTIFIVTGDHGISERSPSAGENYMALRLNEFQVPLIIYAPALFPEGKVMPQAGGHTDLFPTIAGITGKTYQNTTMGRDLLDPSFGDDRLVFVRRSDVPPTLVRADFCYSMEWEGDGSIYTKAADSVREDWQKVENPDPEQIAEFKMLTESLWESARYISHFNTKREASEAN